MKKTALAFVFVLISIQIYAQNIKFCGVPLGIGIEKFEPLLKQKGYNVTPIPDKDSVEARYMTYYNGVFAGSKVSLSVASTPISKLVQIISAAFTEYSMDVPNVTELSIERKFNEIKASLKKKYPSAKKTEWSEGRIIKAYLLQTSKWKINLSIQVLDGIEGLHIMYVDNDAQETAKHEFEMDY